MASLRADFTGTDRFRVERLLGEGGFGSVYQVFDRERDERVALKTLHRLDGDALYRFKREFRTLADVSDPALVSFHELFAEGDRWFFTMELVDGTDFLSYVSRLDASDGHDSVDGDAQTVTCDSAEELFRPADEARLRWALTQLVTGVQNLHGMGILHRDIKPQNVLVSAEGRVVLLDFGLITRTGSSHSTLDQVVGTVAYMAPEQAMGKELTEAADWYAVGVMLYEALSGRLPHRGQPFQVIIEKQYAPPPPPSELTQEISSELSDLTMRLLSTAPTTRPDGDEIRRVLGDVEAPTDSKPAPDSDSTSSARTFLPPHWRPDPGSSRLGKNGNEHSPSRAGAETPFVGRDGELGALVEALDRVGRGRPVVVEVLGRSGMGKSALLECFLSSAADRRDAVVLPGRCYEQESVPYKALDSVVDALCRYLLSLDDVTAAGLMPRDARALSRLFPVLDRVKAVRTAPAASAEVPDLQEIRHRAFSALGELLGRIADRQPLVVAIDDLQWGDADSALLLTKLLTQADPPGMLLLLSYRSEERERSPFLGELLEGTALRSCSSHLEVGALAEAPARELALALLGTKASENQATAVVSEAAGCPFFIHLLSKYASSQGRSVTFEEALAALTGDLPDKVRLLLEVVAVSGRPVSPLTAIGAAGLQEEGWRTVEALRAGHLLRRWGGEGDQLECYHDRLRETVVGELDEARLRACHGALADALTGAGDADPERLAVHLEGAGRHSEAAENSEEAADLAAEKLAFERAARLYQRALELGSHDVDGARTLRIKLADALANAGLGAEAAPEYLAAASGLSRVASLELRRRAALHLLSMGRFDEGHEVLGEVLRELGMKLSKTLRQALLSVIVQRARLRMRGLSFDERDESEIDPELLLRADVCWAVSAGFRATEVTFAMDYATRHLALALTAGEPHRISVGLSMEAVTLTLLNRKKEQRATEILDRATAMAERLDDPRALAFAQLSAGMMAWLHGRWREALVQSERSARLYQERCTGVSFELAQAHAVEVWSLYYCGEVREIVRRVPELTLAAWSRGDLFAAISYVGGYGFLAWLAGDDVEATRNELAKARAAWPGEGFQLQHYLLLLGDVMVELYCGRGRAALDKVTGSWSLLERTFFLRVPAQRAKWFHLRAAAQLSSALAEQSGSPERERLFRTVDRSLRELESIDFPTAKPHARLIKAGRLAARGETDRAADLLDGAEQAFDELEMPLHRAVARWCRAAAVDDEAGRRARAMAEKTFRAEGIARPDRMARMLAPGFEE